MWRWIKQKCRTSIVDQVEDELYQCSRDLLEAEGILERAQANVAMLQARDERLRKRMAPDEHTPMGVPLSDMQAAGLVNACRARIIMNPEQEATS